MQRPLLTLTAAAALAACGTDPVEPPPVSPGPRLEVAATTPTVVPAVAAGQLYTTCALDSGGQIRCWGTTTFGATTPAPLPSGVVYTGVSTGANYGCGARSDGQVACWGNDEYGRATPAALAAGVTYTQVSANNTHACAVRSDGGISCWGLAAGGFGDPGRLAVPALPPGVRYQQVGVGNWHACAVRSDGTIACWGDFASGQTRVPALPAGATYTQVSGGERFNCAVRSDGQVVCWGDGAHGRTTPATLPEGVTYTQVGAGVGSACAVRSDGQVACWGDNGAGQATPPAVAGVTYRQVAVGRLHACALRADGQVVCWGDNLNGAATPPAGLNLIYQAQSITFTSTPPSPALVGGSYGVRATGGASGNTVTFSSLTPATCTVSGGSVSLVAAGVCTVAADQAAGVGYASAPQATQSFAISKAAQTITFESTPPAPALLGGTYEVTATGGGSGNPTVFSSLTPATCGVSGGAVSFVAVGSCTVAADQAGNAAYDAAPRVTQTVAVVYAFTGFFAPVSNLPTVNVAKAGSALPLKFALGGNQGLAVLAAGSPRSQAVACQSGAATAPVEQMAKAGSSSLSYDVLSGQYTYTWKTDRAWAGTCRRLTVGLVDGTTHAAEFKF